MSVVPDGYDSAHTFESRPEPAFEFIIKLLAGDEGEQLELEQAMVILEILEWLEKEGETDAA